MVFNFNLFSKKSKKAAPILSLDTYSLLSILKHCFTKEEDIASLSLVCKHFRRAIASQDVDFVPRSFPFPYIGCDGAPTKDFDMVIYFQQAPDYSVCNKLLSITAEDCIDEFNLGKGFTYEMRNELVPHIMTSYGADPLTCRINTNLTLGSLPAMKLHCRDVANYVKWFSNPPKSISKKDRKDWPENAPVTPKAWDRWKQGLYAFINRIHDESPIAFAVQCNDVSEESAFSMRRSSHHMSSLESINKSIIPAFSTMLDKSNFLEYSVFVSYFLVDPIFGKLNAEKEKLISSFFETMYKSCFYDVARLCKLKDLFRIMPQSIKELVDHKILSIFDSAIQKEDEMFTEIQQITEEEEPTTQTQEKSSKKSITRFIKSRKSSKNSVLTNSQKRLVTVGVC